MEDLSASGSRGHRTLAAVVFTDGVNFSARMSQDEERTLDLINRDLTLMRELCQNHEGRVLKSTGDGLLMFFSSAINAVNCALEIQREIAEAAALLPATEALQHRIGIHLGDVFISETDVMGTGVNIAARLQGQADPGGICISQTVYDVVKTNVSMTSTYMGLRKLKNIQEEIPVYCINQKEEEVLWAEANNEGPVNRTEQPQIITHFTPQLDPHQAVAQLLAEHEYTLRIRKLLLCVCRNVWENNPSTLQQTNLEILVQELLAKAPTSETLQMALDRVIRSLSKRAEYEVVARIITNAFERLYTDLPNLPPTQLEMVAQRLEQAPHVERIKKLILCVCRDIWENDSTTLSSLRLTDLLAELLEIAPTLKLFKAKLHQVVQTLNKREAYTALANTIIQVIQPLYPAEAPPITSPPTPLQAVAVTPPQPVPAVPPPPASTFNPEPLPAPQRAETSTTTANPVAASQAALNWFDIRLDLMRYTNPLRAKILIFSALNGDIGLSEMNLLSLRMHPLDALLQNLIQLCPTRQDMEEILHTTAKKLEDPDLCFQAAGSILQAFRPIYESATLLELARQTSVETNDPTLVRPVTAGSPAKMPPSSEEDDSCQLLPRSMPNLPA